MESTHSVESQQLLGVVRGIRNRYRAKRALLGAAIAVAGSWIFVATAAYLLSVFKYSDNAILAARIGSGVAILGLVLWFVVRPFLPKLADTTVALYLEEHEKSLKASVITAVEMQSGAAVPGEGQRSPLLLDRLTRSALKRVHDAGDGK